MQVNLIFTLSFKRIALNNTDVSLLIKGEHMYSIKFCDCLFDLFSLLLELVIFPVLTVGN